MAELNKNLPVEQQVFQLHECLEDLKNTVIPQLTAMKTEITAARRGHLGIARRVVAVSKNVTETKEELLSVAEVAKAKAETAAEVGERVEKKLDQLNINAWRFVLTIVGGVILAGIVAVAGIAYQATINQQSTMQAVQHTKP